MTLQAEQAVNNGVIALLLQKRYRQKFPLGFGHFSAFRVQMMHMEPVAAPFMTEISLRLRNFIGVVRESIVNAAAMDVQILPEMLEADAGALNMPAGIADAPRGIPFERLIFKFRLGKPQHKVIFVSFVLVFLHALADADLQILFIVVVENIVLFQF